MQNVCHQLDTAVTESLEFCLSNLIHGNYQLLVSSVMPWVILVLSLQSSLRKQMSFPVHNFSGIVLWLDVRLMLYWMWLISMAVGSWPVPDFIFCMSTSEWGYITTHMLKQKKVTSHSSRESAVIQTFAPVKWGRAFWMMKNCFEIEMGTSWSATTVEHCHWL